MGYDIFRDCQYAPLPVEFDPVGGIGRKLDFARFCSEASNDISNRTSSLKLRHQQSSVGRIVPNPQLMHRASEDLLAGVTVTRLKGSVDFQEAAFLQRRNRKGNRAGVEYFLKLLVGNPAACLRLIERAFGVLQVR